MRGASFRLPMKVRQALLRVCAHLVAGGLVTCTIAAEVNVICPPLVEVLRGAEWVLATKVETVQSFGMLRKGGGTFELADRGEIAFVVTRERIIRDFRSKGGPEQDRSILVLSFSACDSCFTDDALEFAPRLGRARVLLANQPTFPGLLGIPGALRDLAVSFDVIGSSTCADLQLDESGFNKDLEGALVGRGK